MKKYLAYAIGTILLMFTIILMSPSRIGAQLRNAVTRAALKSRNWVITGNWTLNGTWDFTGGTLRLKGGTCPPAAGGCDADSDIRTVFICTDIPGGSNIYICKDKTVGWQKMLVSNSAGDYIDILKMKMKYFESLNPGTNPFISCSDNANNDCEASLTTLTEGPMKFGLQDSDGNFDIEWNETTDHTLDVQNIGTGRADIQADGDIISGRALRSSGWAAADDFRTTRRYPIPVAVSSVGDTSIQFAGGGRGIITFGNDDPTTETIAILRGLSDGTSTQRTPVNDTNGTGASSQTVIVTDPGVAGFLANGLTGTNLFRPGNRIKIGTNATTTILRVDSSSQFVIADAQSWADSANIDIVVPWYVATPPSEDGLTHTGRVGASDRCTGNRKNDDGATAANSASGSIVTITGGTFAFSATEQVNFDGGMIRFCTDVGCTADEAARYVISDVTGAGTLTVVGTIPGAHSGVGFYIAAGSTDDCWTAADLVAWRGDDNEVVFHGNDHTALNNMTEAVLTADVTTGLPLLESKSGGLVKNIIYPFDGYRPGMELVLRKYFRSGTGSGPSTAPLGAGSVPPLLTYNLSRTQQTDTVNFVLATAESQRDNAATDGAWINFFGHAYGVGMEAQIGDFIDSTILNKPDMLLLTIDEALDVIGNPLDSPGLAIGVNGTMMAGQTVQGLAEAGTATTVTLRKGSVATVDKFYVGWKVRIKTGTGVGQTIKTVRNYVASTRVLTIEETWSPAPDGTSIYELIPQVVNIQSFKNPTIWGDYLQKSDSTDVVWEIDTSIGGILRINEADSGFYHLVESAKGTQANSSPWFIGSDDSGFMSSHVQTGRRTAGGNDWAMLHSFANGLQQPKTWILRDGEIGTKGIASGSIHACGSVGNPQSQGWKTELVYNTTDDTWQSCDGTNWQPWLKSASGNSETIAADYKFSNHLETPGGAVPTVCVGNEVWVKVDAGGDPVLCCCDPDQDGDGVFELCDGSGTAC